MSMVELMNHMYRIDDILISICVNGGDDHVLLWMLEAFPSWKQDGLGRPIVTCAHAHIHGVSPFQMHDVETLEHRHYGWCLDVGGCRKGSRIEASSHL